MHVSGRCSWLILAAWTFGSPAPMCAEPLPEAPARVRAVEIDFSSLAPLTRSVMRHELGVVLAPASLALAWRRSRPDAETNPDELRVVLLRSIGVGGDEGALGSTARRGLVPTIWVYVPTVALALGLELEAVATSLDAQRLVGLALGRVVAHEIVHVLAPDVGHGGASVMRPRLQASHLTRGQQALESDCAAALAAGGRAWLLTPIDRSLADR